MIIILTIAFAVLFVMIRVAINDTVRGIGSDRRNRRARDRHVDRLVREQNRRINRR